ncbi:MAG: tetratricopeptide repeat protein [Verrucomicrobia bacterium]|nr:tetratricopeptide repeat protein [Verrucomicrobiota bacterium]
MNDEIPIQQVLQNILETQGFERLDAYTDQQVWQTMSEEERNLLCHAFACAGEVELKAQKSDSSVASARKFFQFASSVSSSNAMVWYRRARAFMGQSQQGLLEEASLCFDKAVTIDPTFFEAWYAWANLLMFLGSLAGDVTYFEMAEEKFKAARKLIEKEPLENHSTFFWHYGLAWFTIAGASGEAYDYHMAIQFFKMARGTGLANNDFLNIFGNTYMSLFLLTNNQEMLFEAIELYLHSLDIDENCEDSPQEIAARYCNLGRCYEYLFDTYHEPSFFAQAQACFSSAVQSNSACSNSWSSWGNLLLLAAKLWQDVTFLEESVKKFTRATEFAHDNPLLLSRFAEGYSHLGSHEENLLYLQEAKELAKQALELAPDMPECWCASACVSYHLGRYFSDEAYLHEASKAAEQGLVICPLYGGLWYALGLSQFALGEMNDDAKRMEDSLSNFLKASSSDVGKIGSFWHDWGYAALSVAEMTQDLKLAQEAADKLEQAIIMQEIANPNWLVSYATALDLLGDLTDEEYFYDKAIEILTHVIQIDQENNAARYQLALSLNYLGELTSDLSSYEKAIECLRQILEDDPEDEQVWHDVGLAFIAMAELSKTAADQSLKKMYYDDALQNLLVAAQLGNEHVFYYIACLHSLKGDLSQAIQYFEKAFESKTLPPVEEVLEDDWLEALRSTTYFERFLKRLTK